MPINADHDAASQSPPELSLGGISEKYLPPTPTRCDWRRGVRQDLPGFRTDRTWSVNDHDSSVTDQQVAEIRAKALAISGFTDRNNNPDAMGRNAGLDGVRDPSVPAIETVW